MKQIKKRKLKLPIFIAILAVLVFTFIVYAQLFSTTQYVSKDLKISLNYPSGWYIDDRYQSILLTNYRTNQNRDDKPTAEQIEIYISEFSNCFSSLEEDLMYPACGQRKDGIPNDIVLNEMNQISGGTFHKYITRTPENNELVYYFLENGERLLRISKEPDSSQYEKEFEEIIGSIRFL